ncbi:MAG: response regulator [Lachnospiraceae bacterium]|nr:response regulator [Lachnospiraceae bacterium]
MEIIKVIIVDDESLARDIIIEGIPWEDYGFTAYSASDGTEAMEIIKKDKIDIVITDIKMPRMDGLELIRQINKLNPAIICVVMSSYNEFELVRTAMKLGAYDYIFKPTMMPEDVLKTVQEVSAKVQEQENGWVEESRRADKKKPIYVVRMLLSMYQEKLKDTFRGDYEIMRFTIENIITEIAENKFSCEIQSGNFYDYYFKVWETEDSNFDNDMETRLMMYAEEIQFYFQKYYKMKCSMGVSEKSESMDDLFELQTQAMELAQKANIMGELILFHSTAARHEISDKIWQVLDYINDNLCNKELSLWTVSEYIGISKNYLSKLFKEEMKINFVDYITKKKLERAKDLYLSTDKKIYEIAEVLGYSDWHYLYALYKKEYGYSLSREKEREKKG